jgi:hypothetical protein
MELQLLSLSLRRQQTQTQTQTQTTNKNKNKNNKKHRLALHAALLKHNKTIPVMIWPLVDQSLKKQGLVSSADVLHIEQNGIEESPWFELAVGDLKTSSLNHPDIVWVTDVKFSYKQWCERLAQKIPILQALRKNASLSTQWPIFVVDFTDLTTYVNCRPIEKAMGLDYVFYSKRSIVTERKWDNVTNWVDLGERLPTLYEGRHYQHTPLIARTDTLQALQRILQQDKYHNASLHDSIEEIPKSVDMAHYWPNDGRSNINTVASKLRNQINRLMCHNNNNDNDTTTTLSKKYTVFCGLVGTADMVGRRKAQSSFIQAMLDTKIIVVTQRDKWEDQYRLYEALLSGAMVMTDRMLTLPEGLQHNVSIVEFDSAVDLQDKARHYLEHKEERIAIAKRGRAVVLSRHRSWHRMEEIILGQAITMCDDDNDDDDDNNKPSSSSRCPYNIHANEIR